MKELVCDPIKETVPQKKVVRSCSWPPKKHHDKWCTRSAGPLLRGNSSLIFGCFRRSDYDVFLEEGDDFTHGREYLDTFMETPIDFVSVFPDDFEGSPNVTVTPDGKRYTPRARSMDSLDLFDESLISSYSHHGDSFVSEVPDFAASAFREVPSPDLSRKPSTV